mmetsp:Transcript_9314/g.16535  ORF Transcript_9314/g.16535 Transcript_9314/m.16535 type:complete len:216 (-) Transcript_9314:59-706(-)
MSGRANESLNDDPPQFPKSRSKSSSVNSTPGIMGNSSSGEISPDDMVSISSTVTALRKGIVSLSVTSAQASLSSAKISPSVSSMESKLPSTKTPTNKDIQLLVVDQTWNGVSGSTTLVSSSRMYCATTLPFSNTTAARMNGSLDATSWMAAAPGDEAMAAASSGKSCDRSTMVTVSSVESAAEAADDDGAGAIIIIIAMSMMRRKRAMIGRIIYL